MNWRVKGLLQKTLSVLPGGTNINDLLQTTVGTLRNFEANVDRKVIDDWCVLASHMTELGRPLENLDYFEIGTGWYPTLPVCYALANAKSCQTFDISRHLRENWTFRMLRRIECHLPAIAVSSQRTLSEVEGEYHALLRATTIDQLLHRSRVHYHAPADATDCGLPDASIDVVFSNSVFEHVTPYTLTRIMSESIRILRPGGIVIHSVNCGDHYAYFDPRITAMNYLTYDEDRWRFWNSSLLYQNRMRPCDFLEAAERAGFALLLVKQRPRPELLNVLPKLKIVPEFDHYAPEQLATTSIDFVAEKPVCPTHESIISKINTVV